MAVQLLQHQLLKRLSLSHYLAFAAFVNDWLTMLHGSVSGLCIDSIDLFSGSFSDATLSWFGVAAVVQLPSHVWLFGTPWTTPGLPILHHLPEFAQVHVHWVSDAIQPSHPLLQSSSAFSLSQNQQYFPNELALHIMWPKYWSFSFSISPSNEYSGFVSFKTDWFDLVGVQGTFKSLFQHHSSKASILWHCLDYCAGGSLAAQLCPTLATPWTVDCQALLFMEFSRQRILEWVAISFSTCLM